MYNRYVPRQDGSYTRRSVPDPAVRQEKPPSKEPEPIEEPQQHRPSCRATPNPTVGGFLKRLLPQDFDTGDLIVILLLLLMAGDSQEDRNNAILTIALYFLL